MSDKISAKIVSIDTSKILPNESEDWNTVSEISFLVDIGYNDITYYRKLTFRVHDQKIYNIGDVVIKDDVEKAILTEVDQIKSLHELVESLSEEIGVDQVKKISDRLEE